MANNGVIIITDSESDEMEEAPTRAPISDSSGPVTIGQLQSVHIQSSWTNSSSILITTCANGLTTGKSLNSTTAVTNTISLLSTAKVSSSRLCPSASALTADHAKFPSANPVTSTSGGSSMNELVVTSESERTSINSVTYVSGGSSVNQMVCRRVIGELLLNESMDEQNIHSASARPEAAGLCTNVFRSCDKSNVGASGMVTQAACANVSAVSSSCSSTSRGM